MTVLVTGGAGFLGTRLVEALLARGEKVRIFDLRANDAAHLADMGAELIAGDILSTHELREALHGCERVFHVAALFRMWLPDRTGYRRVNVDGTRNVMEAALEVGVRRLVHTSSAVTIGEGQGQLGCEGTVHRGYFLSEYERSKCLAEQLAFEICDRGLPVVVVNPTSVYGPGQTAHMTGALARFLRGRLPAVVDTRLNFVYVDDVVDGHLSAMERGEVGRRYILGGENASLAEFLSLGAEIAGLYRRPRIVPAVLVRASARVLDVVSCVSRRRPWVSVDEARTASHSFIFDTSKAQQELGLEWTPLRAGLERTVNWLRQEGLVWDAHA
ncbi:MAG TPA: SDR family oxidoreductase [Anaerolineae bacterium]|nr:SDR family oxidoreductase [Anaerolineae bacterium]